MTYFNYCIGLSKAERQIVDKEVFLNRIKFFKKGKVIVISTGLGIVILFSGMENVEAIGLTAMPEAPIMRSTEFVPSYAKLTVEKEEKISFVRKEEVREIDQTYFDLFDLPENRTKTVNELVKLRGGDMSPLTRALFRLLLIWAMGQGHTPTTGFQPGGTNLGFGYSSQAGPAPRIAPKLQENPLNRNNPGQGACTNKQNSEDGTLTRSQKRNLPHEGDVYISEEKVVIRHRQGNFKMKKHGHDFDLPYYKNESGWKKTPRTPENLQIFKDKLVETTLKGKKIEGTYRGDQKVIHYFDSKTRRNVIYDADTKEFISGWKLTPEQIQDLIKNKNVGKF